MWFPNALQNIQNSTLRIATGSLKMASIDHLHQEASVLPVNALLPVPPQRPLTKPSLSPDHHCTTPLQHQAHPAVSPQTLNVHLPRRWHHLLTPIASLFDRSTPTQLPRPSLPIPRTGCWGSNRLWSPPPYFWAAAPQGPSHYPLTTSLKIFLGHEGIPALHWSQALSGMPWMRGPLPLGPASLASLQDLLISRCVTCGNYNWRWRISFSPSLLSLTFPRSPLPILNLPLHIPGEGISNNNNNNNPNLGWPPSFLPALSGNDHQSHTSSHDNCGYLRRPVTPTCLQGVLNLPFIRLTSCLLMYLLLLRL